MLIFKEELWLSSDYKTDILKIAVIWNEVYIHIVRILGSQLWHLPPPHEIIML